MVHNTVSTLRTGAVYALITPLSEKEILEFRESWHNP